MTTEKKYEVLNVFLEASLATEKKMKEAEVKIRKTTPLYSLVYRNDQSQKTAASKRQSTSAPSKNKHPANEKATA